MEVLLSNVQALLVSIGSILFPWLVLLAQALFIAFLVWFFVDVTSKRRVFISWVRKRALLLAFIVSVTATIGSLFYSNIVGHSPCPLCWWQRIFMFSQVFIYGVALYLRDVRALVYGFVLSLIGAGIALYHYGAQVMVLLAPATESLVPCSPDGISCAAVFTWHFGYITMPLMAFTAFMLLLLIGVISYVAVKYSAHKK